MKIIPKISVVLILLCAVMFTGLQSCQKYEDGPTFSIRTKTERVSNRWEVDNYKINGADYTSLMGSYDETFSKSGAYSYTWSIANGNGTWAFQNNDMEIKLAGNDDISSRTLYILKLEEKSFWYYYTEDGDRHEFHMIAK